MEKSSPGLCLILKSLRENETEDESYVTELCSTGLTVDFIPVLSFEFCNVIELKTALLEPEIFSGIIFTSPRAVQAVVGSLSGSGEILNERWKTSKNFAVGKTTSAAFALILIPAENLCLTTEGDASGNADALAKYIIKCMQPDSLPLLFPCGNLRSETMPRMLREAGITCKSLMVYETKCHPELSSNIGRIVAEKGIPEYLIFFSPSGVKMAVPIFRALPDSFTNIKCVAIGPSTEEALRKENIEPYCTAAEPSAKGVKEAILDAGAKRRSK